jgi:hypothetical protein
MRPLRCHALASRGAATAPPWIQIRDESDSSRTAGPATVSLRRRAAAVHRSAKASAGAEELSGDPLRVVRGEEGGDGRDVIDLADAAERCLRDGGRVEVAPNPRRALNHAVVESRLIRRA